MSEDNWLIISHAVPVRQMTDKGIAGFRTYLTNAKAGISDPFPDELLRDDMHARILDRHVLVEPKSFSTTLEMALYLHPRIASLQLPGKYYDPGLWAWLTAYYLDVVCPPDGLGNRKVGEIARYIPPQDRKYYESNRHLLAVPVRMYDQHGEQRIKLLLSSPPDQQTLTLNLITQSQELSTNPSILDALMNLYWDEKNQKPKRGFGANGRPGTLRRFVAMMNQFNRTFDLFTMSGEQIINLLPREEFERWLS